MGNSAILVYDLVWIKVQTLHQVRGINDNDKCAEVLIRRKERMKKGYKKKNSGF